MPRTGVAPLLTTTKPDHLGRRNATTAQGSWAYVARSWHGAKPENNGAAPGTGNRMPRPYQRPLTESLACAGAQRATVSIVVTA